MPDILVGKVSVGDGATFTPSVTDGVIRWTNNKNLPNPLPYDVAAKVLEEGENELRTLVTTAQGAATTATGAAGTATAAATAAAPASSSSAKKETASLSAVDHAESGYTISTKQAMAVQILLNAYGYKGKDGKALTVDGAFGVNTEYAVVQYQKKNKVTSDGIVGSVTWNLLLGSN